MAEPRTPRADFCESCSETKNTDTKPVNRFGLTPAEWQRLRGHNYCSNCGRKLVKKEVHTND